MTSIKEALKIIQRTIKGDQIEAAVVDVGTMMPLGKVVSDALAQLDSADAMGIAGAARKCADDLANIVEASVRVAHRTGNSFLLDRNKTASMIAGYFTGLLPDASPGKPAAIVTCCITGAIPGDGGACGDCGPCLMGEASMPEPVKRLIAEKNSLLQRIGELEDAVAASPGNGAEEVREALGRLLVEDDSDEADDECELCGGRGTVDAYTDRASGSFEGRDEIGCPSCIERSHSRRIRAALHSTSAAGETTSSDGGGCMADFSSGDPNNLKELMAGPSVFDPPSEAVDVLAMKEACKRAVSECLNQYGRMTFVTEKGWSGLEGQILAAIDKLSPEVKAADDPPDWKQDQAETTRIKPPATAEGGRDEPVAIKPLEWDKHPDEDEWFSHDHGLYDVSEYLVYKSPVSTTAWCLKVRGILLDEDFLGPDAAKAAARDDYEQRIRSALYTHPASLPGVEAIRADERERCARIARTFIVGRRGLPVTEAIASKILDGDRE